MSEEPRRLFERFVETQERKPDEPAFTFVGPDVRRYTFRQLIARAEDVASRLRMLEPGLPLGLLLRSQEDQTLHYLAALRAGVVPAVLTPPNRKLNRAYYAETMAAVVGRSGFAAIVTDVEDLELPTVALAPFTGEPVTSAARGQDSAMSAPEAALLQFSSGTTGIKRGVPLEAAKILAQIAAYGDAIGLADDDVILSWLPLYHDMGFMACLNMPLAYGVHTVMLDPIDWVTRPATFLRAASEFGATLAWNPNFAYAFMADRIRDDELEAVDLRSLRGLVNCSEPVTYASQERFLRRFERYGLRDVFWGCYAMAETTFALTHGTSADGGALDERGPVDGTTLRSKVQVSVGRPLRGVDLIVVDQEGRRLRDRHVGELWVRSPFNFRGYVNDDRATAEAHSGEWYRTGDLGYAIGERFFVTGRKKDVLIVGGVNVFPQDLEDAVSEIEGVVPGRVSAASEFDSSVQSERITILFETEAEGAELRRLVSLIRQKVLAAFQIANFEVHRVEPGWLVKSTSGKMARSANQRKWAGEVAAGRGEGSPNGP
jgi:fatty-acyl-CoA synthase